MSQSYLTDALRNAPIESRSLTDDQPIPIVIRYRPLNNSATNGIALVGVSTNGDIMFFRGSTAASATLDGNISGGASGRIDVSAAGFDTWGEVVDRINSRTAASGWEAFLLDALRSDSSNDAAGTRTRTTTGVQSTGANLLADSDVSVVENLTLNCMRSEFRRFNPALAGRPSLTNWMPILRSFRGLANFVTGALQFRLYYRSGTAETEVARFAGGADNTEQAYDLASGQQGAGYWGPRSGELILVLRGASTLGTWTNGYVNASFQHIKAHDIGVSV